MLNFKQRFQWNTSGITKTNRKPDPSLDPLAIGARIDDLADRIAGILLLIADQNKEKDGIINRVQEVYDFLQGITDDSSEATLLKMLFPKLNWGPIASRAAPKPVADPEAPKDKELFLSDQGILSRYTVDTDPLKPGVWTDISYSKAQIDIELAKKQDKIVPAKVGNLQGLDAAGNSTDSGYIPSDSSDLETFGAKKKLPDEERILIAIRSFLDESKYIAQKNVYLSNPIVMTYTDGTVADKGTTNVDLAVFNRYGSKLEMRVSFEQTSAAATVKNDTVLFPLPDNLEVENNTIVLKAAKKITRSKKTLKTAAAAETDVKALYSVDTKIPFPTGKKFGSLAFENGLPIIKSKTPYGDANYVEPVGNRIFPGTWTLPNGDYWLIEGAPEEGINWSSGKFFKGDYAVVDPTLQQFTKQESNFVLGITPFAQNYKTESAEAVELSDGDTVAAKAKDFENYHLFQVSTTAEWTDLGEIANGTILNVAEGTVWGGKRALITTNPNNAKDFNYIIPATSLPPLAIGAINGSFTGSDDDRVVMVFPYDTKNLFVKILPYSTIVSNQRQMLDFPEDNFGKNVGLGDPSLKLKFNAIIPIKGWEEYAKGGGGGGGSGGPAIWGNILGDINNQVDLKNIFTGIYRTLTILEKADDQLGINSIGKFDPTTGQLPQTRINGSPLIAGIDFLTIKNGKIGNIEYAKGDIIISKAQDTVSKLWSFDIIRANGGYLHIDTDTDLSQNAYVGVSKIFIESSAKAIVNITLSENTDRDYIIKSNSDFNVIIKNKAGETIFEIANKGYSNILYDNAAGKFIR